MKERDTYLEFTEETQILEAGSYWIYVKMDWDATSWNYHRDEMTLTMNCYGAHNVSIVHDTQSDLPDFLEGLLLSKARAVDRSEFEQPSDQIQMFRYTSPVEDGFQYVYIVNEGDTYVYNEKMTYPAFAGCVIIDNH